jgi:adenylate cyclase
MRISLSVKLIMLVVGFLGAFTAIFAQQASELFASVLVQREEYSNMVQAAAKANEVEQLISSAVDRAQVTGTLMLKHAGEKKSEKSEASVSFNKDKNLIAIDVVRISGDSPELVDRYVKEKTLEKAGLEAGFIPQLRQLQKFPFDQVIAKKITIQNSSFPKGYPLLTFGIPIARDDQDRVTHVAIADVDLGYLQRSFSGESERVLFVYDHEGNLLAHQDERKALARHSLIGHPLVRKSQDDLIPRRQIQFVDPDTDSKMIGAYVRIPSYGLTVVSQTPESVILEPAAQVRQKTFFIAGTIISIAIFCFFLFSGSLTEHLEVLHELVAEVEKGNFQTKAKGRVRFLFPDEVADLARAFDRMTDGLVERDRVKNLFRKFHGSSVTEDILKQGNLLGGQKKEVTVFFSDIRGFTSFSESHTPEEVVEMLNEYFEIMVGIITSHGGVVDKFIGDAIMAVWGAPHSTDHDAQNAVRACLEMRKALQSLNERRIERRQQPLMIGMGLHLGHVISGTIGSTERLEYTVIGDTVNVASRIEASTKAFGADLLLSETVMQRVKEGFLIEYAGNAEIKGKSNPLSLFKVKGYFDEAGNPVEVKSPYSEYAAEAVEKAKIAS